MQFLGHKRGFVLCLVFHKNLTIIATMSRSKEHCNIDPTEDTRERRKGKEMLVIVEVEKGRCNSTRVGKSGKSTKVVRFFSETKGSDTIPSPTHVKSRQG